MKKITWKSSFAIKAVLIILSIGAWTLCLAGIIGTYCLGQTGIYSATGEDAAREALNERIAEQYSILAVVNDHYGKEALENTNFRYGVITGYTLSEAEEQGLLDDPEVYVYQNFEEGIPSADERKVHSYTYDEYRTGFYVPLNLLSEGRYYMDYTPDGEENENYIVVSTIADKTYDAGFYDLYRQEDNLLMYAYSMDFRELCPAMIVLGVVLAVVLTVLLCISAGWRRVTEENGEKTERLLLRRRDYFPLDLGLLTAFFLFTGLFGAVTGGFLDGYGVDRIIRTPLLLLYVVVPFYTAAWLVFLAALMSLCANIRFGGAWSRTLLGRFFRWLRAEFKKAREQNRMARSVRDLKIRCWGIFGGITFLELIAVAFLTSNSYSGLGGIAFLCWLIEKIVLAAFLLRFLGQFGELKTAGQRIADGDFTYRVDTGKMLTDLAQHGEDLNRIKDGMDTAISERVKSERFQTELITNVSHDIKTPLTSIINYVDLLGKEELPGEKAREYVTVLTRQSERLKKLIQDLIDASKASSGSMKLTSEEINLSVLLTQMTGEYEEKMKNAGIDLIVTKPENAVMIKADSRNLSRVFDNLMGNIAKYAQRGTRAYVDLEAEHTDVICVTFRNTSAEPLNITSEELLQRFVRGDRSRSTEGSGLGLSIAESLTKLMGGELSLTVDGDLFKVVLTFPA